jgi:hypothetical protein
MLIRLAGRQAAVATTSSLKATLAIQPRLADGNVADGRGIDPRAVSIKDDKVGHFARHDYTGEILAALPSGIGRHPSVTRPRRVLSPHGSARHRHDAWSA